MDYCRFMMVAFMIDEKEPLSQQHKQYITS